MSHFRRGARQIPYVITDDAGVQKGSHYLQFGFYGKQIRVRSSITREPPRFTRWPWAPDSPR